MNRDEQLSALMDGELEDPLRDESLAAVGRDAEMAARWERYHLISDVLHREVSGASLTGGLAERVSEALRDEPTVLAPRPPAWRRLGARVGRQVAGLAVAASVAVAVVLVAWQPQTPDIGTGAGERLAGERGQVAAPDEGGQLARVAEGSGGGGQADNPRTAGAPSRGGSPLERYLVNHSEYSVSGGVLGRLPYMRVVGHSSGVEVASRDGQR